MHSIRGVKRARAREKRHEEENREAHHACAIMQEGGSEREKEKETKLSRVAAAEVHGKRK